MYYATHLSFLSFHVHSDEDDIHKGGGGGGACHFPKFDLHLAETNVQK